MKSEVYIKKVVSVWVLGGCLPSNKAKDIKGQVEYGKRSKGDEEQHNSKAPPSPDGQTGLEHRRNKQIIGIHFSRYKMFASLKTKKQDAAMTVHEKIQPVCAHCLT